MILRVWEKNYRGLEELRSENKLKNSSDARRVPPKVGQKLESGIEGWHGTPPVRQYEALVN